MAASSSSVSQSKFKIDPHSPLWRHVEMIQQQLGGGVYLWKCNGYDVQYNSSYSRVKAHLCNIPGMGIKACPGKSNKPIPREQVLAYITEQEAADEAAGRKSVANVLRKRGRNQRMGPPSIPSSNVVIESHPFLVTPQEQPTSTTNKRPKGPLETSFQNEARDIADQHIARCIYANGMSFNVVRSPYWQEMVRKINEAPKGYKSPGYEKVRGTLLENEVKNIEDALKPLRDSWSETGVSIVSDGWKDARNRPLINVIAVSPKGAMFLRAVDCEGQVKDGEFIAQILIAAIEDVGPRNVVQVITDNAKNCRAAGLLVEERYSHIFWTPCAVHSLNLMLQKIGKKIDWIRELYAEAEEIRMFITNHHMSQSIFRSFSTLELLKVAETRFASNTIALRRLVKVKQALISMVTSTTWSVWRQSNTERAANVKGMILNDYWWDRVEYLLSFTEPILSMIRYTDMDKPCMGEIYDGIDSMIEKIKNIINEKEKDPQEILFKQVHEIIEARWNTMTTPLHLLAFALTPKYYSSEILSVTNRIPPWRDLEVSEGYKAAFRRLFLDPDLHDMVTDEFTDFVHSNGLSIEALRDRFKKDAHNWWYFHGQQFRCLQPLAVKVLSQVASSSASERNWSTYSFIHSIKRNRLHSKKAENLVYVHSNLRLLSHKKQDYKEGESKLWDVEPEQIDLDASTSQSKHVALEGSESEHTFSASGSGAGCGSSNDPANVQEDDDDVEDLANPYDD